MYLVQKKCLRRKDRMKFKRTGTSTHWAWATCVAISLSTFFLEGAEIERNGRLQAIRDVLRTHRVSRKKVADLCRLPSHSRLRGFMFFPKFL